MESVYVCIQTWFVSRHFLEQQSRSCRISLQFPFASLDAKTFVQSYSASIPWSISKQNVDNRRVINPINTAAKTVCFLASQIEKSLLFAPCSVRAVCSKKKLPKRSCVFCAETLFAIGVGALAIEENGPVKLLLCVRIINQTGWVLINWARLKPCAKRASLATSAEENSRSKFLVVSQTFKPIAHTHMHHDYHERGL